MNRRYLQIATISILAASAAVPAWATTAPVPEPGTVFLIGAGLGALILLERRRRSSR